MKSVRINMEAVAKAAGVHRTTVSMALRDHPNLAAATKARVRAVAERMGYRPNPLVQALMATRAGRGRQVYQAELAFVSNSEVQPDWERGDGAYAQMFRGARAQAERRGYRLRPWWRAGAAMSGERFGRILAARNIHGILIAPHSGAADQRIDLPWDRFSVVELGYNLIAPDFHRVVHDYFHGMKLALARLRAAGVRRPALVLTREVDAKVHHLWRAAFVDEQQGWPAEDCIAPWLIESLDPGVFRRWFDAHRPEVILGITSRLIEPAAREAGLRIPQDVGFVHLACHERAGRQTGVFQNWERMGTSAVDQLIGMLHRGEQGVPEQSQSTLISGLWTEGETLRGGA